MDTFVCRQISLKGSHGEHYFLCTSRFSNQICKHLTRQQVEEKIRFSSLCKRHVLGTFLKNPPFFLKKGGVCVCMCVCGQGVLRF